MISQSIPRILNDRYEVREELGRGGMGAVYWARDTLLEREVAIKLISSAGVSDDQRAPLLREAQIIAKLNHPNIVQVHDAG